MNGADKDDAEKPEEKPKKAAPPKKAPAAEKKVTEKKEKAPKKRAQKKVSSLFFRIYSVPHILYRMQKSLAKISLKRLIMSQLRKMILQRLTIRNERYVQQFLIRP